MEFPRDAALDAERAREMVLAGFGRYLRNAAEHSLYIDGTVLYPGFELDELCAPLLALEQYVRATEDYAVLEEVGLGRHRASHRRCRLFGETAGGAAPSRAQPVLDVFVAHR